jgi:hypothetical protein
MSGAERLFVGAALTGLGLLVSLALMTLLGVWSMSSVERFFVAMAITGFVGLFVALAWMMLSG